MRRLKAFLTVAVLMVSTSAQAGAIIDFIGFQGGTITAVGGGDVVGAHINISMVQFIDTPQNEGAYDVIGGFLNFNTVSDNLTIVGAIPDLNIPFQPLLHGTITDFTFSANGPVFNFIATGPDRKAVDLLTAAGLPVDVPFVFAGFSISAKPNGTSGVYNVFSTDIGNTAVPEPSSILLLGSGLLALGFLGRRKLS
jgi:hypothetical protein